jgi:integrase
VYLPAGVSRADAKTVKTKIEGILSAGYARQELSAELAQWLGDIPDSLYEKLEAVGLVRARRLKADGSDVLLGNFSKAYIDERAAADFKPATTHTFHCARKNLIAFFGDRKLLSAITPGDADAFRRALLSAKCSKGGRVSQAAARKKAAKPLSVNTVNKRCQIAKQIFQAAVRSRIIRENPFADMKIPQVRANRERDHFISQADADAILAACPDAQWRLIFALSRFGGLRCASEHLSLTWDCVDWEHRRVRVISPKTERHAGKGERIIPMFPELETALSEVWDATPAGSTQHVITRYRDGCGNLRTRFLQIIKRAGLKPWPRLFHNLRATRQTELSARFPIHVVCEWLGNSRLVAQEHYLRVTDADFAAAVTSVQGASRDAYTTHDDALLSANDDKRRSQNVKKPLKSANSAGNEQASGVQVATRNSGEKPLEKCGLSSRATQIRRTLWKSGQDDTLSRLIDVWPMLPADVQEQIVELADAAACPA